MAEHIYQEQVCKVRLAVKPRRAAWWRSTSRFAEQMARRKLDWEQLRALDVLLLTAPARAFSAKRLHFLTFGVRLAGVHRLRRD